MILDKWTSLYYSFNDWYTGLWHNTLGDTGTAVVGGVCGIAIVVAIGVLVIGTVRKAIGK